MPRTAQITRKTNETSITLTLNIDGEGKFEGGSSIGFLDHMLHLFSRHGLVDLTLNAQGDTFVDCHHTVEDIGLALGSALCEALGGKEGIRRYGSAIIPMDDALVMCAVDLSGRPYLYYEIPFTAPKLGELDTETIAEFFHSVSRNAGMNLHIKLLHGTNNHHIAEAAFKAFAR
ncbi:MAG: imidazoleglycerol-phosphate dehydratase HisB, partial [Clostridiales bacterium]|nr:imidazoleglycerol-phosphate dehydratase HisB [Clostridiales bacterium]